MTINEIGETSLNISFFLYLFLYVPQSIRNLRYKRLNDMSLGFHALIFIAATADLYYGFGRIQQWQYRFVSILMFTLLLAQHIQLFYYLKYFNNGLQKMLSITAVIILMLLFLIPTLAYPAHWMFLFVTMGWVERLCYWGYSIPQYFKNKAIHRADAISPTFLILAIFTAICDAISAWCFNWGPSSKYGAPIAIFLHLLLLYQWYYGMKQNQRLKPA